MDLASYDTGTANPTVNRNRVHPEMVSWPPLEEQLVITDYLDQITQRIDGMIAKIMEAIDRLAEYRSVLITAATTGKIDVRGVKIPHPIAQQCP
jgi:type I restriction enzyme S subunit